LKGDWPLHDLYETHFNWVDLLNRRLYSVEEHHHHPRWEIKDDSGAPEVWNDKRLDLPQKSVRIEWKSWRRDLVFELKDF